MPHTVKRVNWWFAWNYENEEAWLNNLSDQGLHLEEAHLFWSTFTKEPSARYVYRLDYQPDAHNGRKFAEYINLYADAGWEYKSSLMARWHYFRQRYQPGERQELYTDRASLRQHYKRIQGILAVAFFMNLPVALLNLRNLTEILSRENAASIATTITTVVGLQATVMLMAAYGMTQMSRKIKSLP